MRKLNKKLMLASLIVGCASCAMVGGVLSDGAMTQVSANNYNLTVDVPETFTTLGGAQVRKTADTAGIRFSGIVNKDYKDVTLAGKNVEFGMLVIKASDLGENELNADTVGASKIKAENILAVDENADATTDYYRYNVALTNIPEVDYETEIVARAYVTVDGVTTCVGDDNEQQKRSIALVASRAYAANESDPDDVIKGYVNYVAQGVSFDAATQKLNKAMMTAETVGLTATTNPVGYAVKLTSSNEEVAKIENGVIVPQAKEGTATITAEFGSQKSATYTLSVVSYSATLGGEAIAEDSLVKVNVADGYFAALNVATQASDAEEKLLIQEYDGENYTDVTESAAIEYSVENVATIDQGTISGGSVNGTTTVFAKIDGWEVANFDVEGWTEITTIDQMDELSLVTWRERNDKAKIQSVLSGKYVLGANLAYNGDYILPIANMGKGYWSAQSSSWILNSDSAYVNHQSWVWKEILTQKNALSSDYWTENGLGGKYWNKGAYLVTDPTEQVESFLHGSNPNNVEFTGVFDGNGYTISDAQLIDVNYLYNRSDNKRFTSAGGCFIGNIGQGGVLRNVNFEELRYRKYHSTKTAERETLLDTTLYPDMSIWDSKGWDVRPYYDTMELSNQTALVIVNQGLISDVRISTYYKSAYAENTNKALDANNKNAALGVMINEQSGVINNTVIHLLKGEIEYLRQSDFVEGTDWNWDSALVNNYGIGSYVFYSRNYGTVNNSIFLSEPDHGYDYRYNAGGKTSKFLSDFIAGFGDVTHDETYGFTVNAGTVTNTAWYADSIETKLEANEAQTSGCGTPDLTKFDSSMWNTTDMSFKQK